MSKIDIDIRMTENELSRDNNDVNAVMDKLTELIELQKQTNVLLTQQTQNYADFCSTLEKMNHNSSVSSTIIEKLTRAAGIWAVIALVVALANLWVTILISKYCVSEAFCIGCIILVIVFFGLWMTIKPINAANKYAKKIKK